MSPFRFERQRERLGLFGAALLTIVRRVMSSASDDDFVVASADTAPGAGPAHAGVAAVHRRAARDVLGGRFLAVLCFVSAAPGACGVNLGVKRKAENEEGKMVKTMVRETKITRCIYFGSVFAGGGPAASLYLAAGFAMISWGLSRAGADEVWRSCAGSAQTTLGISRNRCRVAAGRNFQYPPSFRANRCRL